MGVEDTEGSTPAELSGLLITNPDKGGDAGSEGGGDDVHVDALPDKSGDGDDDWNSDAGDDTGSQHSDDGGDDEGEGGEGEDEEAKDGQDTEPHYTVKVGGKDVVVSLSEALKGYQRTQDYTQKTQELADSRKAIDTELAQAREARETYASYLKTLRERIGPEANEPTQEQWDALKGQDPEGYAVAWADYQRRQEARKNIKTEEDRIVAEKQTDAKKAIGEHLVKEQDALLKKLPDWKDPKKHEAGVKAIFEAAAKHYGFTDQELSQVYDHRMVLMAEDARKYRALMAKQVDAKRKLGEAPTVPPRARAPQPSKRQVVNAEAEKRFNRTGRVEDALPLLLKG